ncbi:MAG: glycosyltransferase family 4 protein [Phycisphaerales bacterium]|nr:glycosyltransferase family 4 protein [Phycisphaerales bacterium]
MTTRTPRDSKPGGKEQELRITIVLGPFFPAPPAPCGAVEYIWHGLAEEFARRGHEVCMIGRSYPGQARDEEVNGVRFVRRSSFSKTNSIKRDLLKDLLYSTYMLGTLPRADIVVTNVFFMPAMIPILRRGAGKIVVNVARMPKGQIWMYGSAARLAVVSQAVEDAVREERPASMSRVRVIPNPIDATTFVPPASPRVRDGGGTILYTGRIHPEKGLDLLVKAWRELVDRHPRIRLSLTGPWKTTSGGGGEDYLRRLRNDAGDRSIEIRDPIFDRAALAAALQEANYFCYPSVADRGETFGVAPLEAMGTALSPVVSDLACFRDFLEPGVNGLLFDHRSPDAVSLLAAALEELISDPDRAERMGQAASATAQGFGYPAVAELYLNDFEVLLGRRTETAPSAVAG